MNLVKRIVAASGILMARVGIIDESRGVRIADIAWPQFAIGLARTSQRTADVIMVGLAVGPTGIAGLGFAYAYLSLVRGVGFSLGNGAMTFMSQRYGARDIPGMDLAFKQALWLEFFLAGLFTASLYFGADFFIGVLGAGPAAFQEGVIYMQVTAFGLLFVMFNQHAAKFLIAANDAWTPMILRGGGAFLNIFLNIFLIFGLGLGVFGAALGSVIASITVSTGFTIALIAGRLPIFGSVPVTVNLGPPYFDLQLMGQIIEVGSPLVGRRVISRASRFFMLALVAQFGTIIVAAYVASREVREVMDAPGWGFGTAARSLVGQELGSGNEESAILYGWDIIKFAMTVYAVFAVALVVFPGQIASLFTTDPETVTATIPFLMVMAASLLGLGIDNSSSGILSAAGDTRWPFYGRLVGHYVFMIPLAYIGTITSLGIIGIYLAVTAETVVPAVITFFRVNTNKWIDVSRRYRTPAGD